MINLSFGVLHSKAKMAAFGFLLSSKSLTKAHTPQPLPPPLFINDFLGNLGLLFYSSAFGSYYSIHDPLTNVTVVFEYSPVLSILTSMDYCYCLC